MKKVKVLVENRTGERVDLSWFETGLDGLEEEVKWAINWGVYKFDAVLGKPVIARWGRTGLCDIDS